MKTHINGQDCSHLVLGDTWNTHREPFEVQIRYADLEQADYFSDWFVHNRQSTRTLRLTRGGKKLGVGLFKWVEYEVWFHSWEFINSLDGPPTHTLRFQPVPPAAFLKHAHTKAELKQ